MTTVIVVALGYLVGRLAFDLLTVVFRVYARRLVEKSPSWKHRLREDNERDYRLRDEIGMR